MLNVRSALIDFIRGLAILDMMLLHYREYLSLLSTPNFSKLVGYTDFAMEGFTLMAGLMVGYHYFQQFRKRRIQVIRRLLQRATQLLIIYYTMVLTISVPLALYLGHVLTGAEKPSDFIVRSLFLQNQVGLLHILPTFVPLFLLAIPILYLLEKGCDLVVMVISLGVFVLGNIDPYIFNIGDEAIFPVVLWQIYFVAGILLGKRDLFVENWTIKKKYMFLTISLLTFGLGSFLYHGHHLYPFVAEIRDQFGIKVSKFPLNYWGLLYYGSVLSVAVSLTALLWNKIQNWTKIVEAVVLFGRHSLLTFVIHVYFVKMLFFADYFKMNFFLMSETVIAINVFVTLLILRHIEPKEVRRMQIQL